MTKHSHWWRTRSQSKFTSHCAWGTNKVCECKMDVKSTRIPTWHRMDHVSRSLGLLFKNCFLEVGLAQNQETMALQTLTTVVWIYLNHTWGPVWIEIHWNSIWLRARSHTTPHYTWEPVTILHKIGGCVGTAFGHFLLDSLNFVVTALGSCVKWPRVTHYCTV